jgi:putative transposase
MENPIRFFTATCLNWQNLLQRDRHKEIILESLRFMVKDGRIHVYGFVIMPNHIHVLWRKTDEWAEKNTIHHFLKFTAQHIKFNLLANHPEELILYRSTQKDRAYHFWERRPYAAAMHNRKVLEQKLDYIHYNPVKANLCATPEEYLYSSARFYNETGDDFGFLTRYEEHI